MIRENLVFFRNDLKTDKECLEFMAGEIDKCGLLNDKEEYLEAVHRREEEFSTAVGFGVAIPHGKTDAVKESFIAFLKSEDPVLWGKDKLPSQLIFLIGVPDREKSVTHLKYLAQISRHLMDEDFRADLLNCKTIREAYVYLNKINDGIKGE